MQKEIRPDVGPPVFFIPDGESITSLPGTPGCS